MKIISWLSKLLISAVVISSLSAGITGYVINLYVNEIARQLQLPGIVKKIQLSDILARMSEDLNISKSTNTKAAEEAKGQAAAAVSGSAQDPSKVAGTTVDGTAEGSKTPNSNPAKDDAVAVWGQMNNASGANSDKQGMIMSTEEFAKKKDALTSEDKMKIFSLVLTKLPQNEVQRLSVLMEDGITTEEMKEINQTLQKYLKKEEYQQLIGILSHY